MIWKRFNLVLKSTMFHFKNNILEKSKWFVAFHSFTNLIWTIFFSEFYLRLHEKLLLVLHYISISLHQKWQPLLSNKSVIIKFWCFTTLKIFDFSLQWMFSNIIFSWKRLLSFLEIVHMNILVFLFFKVVLLYNQSWEWIISAVILSVTL